MIVHRLHRIRSSAPKLALLLAIAAGLQGSRAQTQHNRLAISPPTAPPPVGTRVVSGDPIAPVSSGLGALQFVQVNYPVPPPQAITRQIESDDERTRQGSLSAIGVPNQYLNHGHVPTPHSIGLEFAQLGNNDELYALLTVEMDNHLVTAILGPGDGGWRRLATVVLPTPFGLADGPMGGGAQATFLHLERSLLTPGHYRAVFRGSSLGANGDFVENEAHVRVLNGRAVVTLSFVSASRQCTVANATATSAATSPSAARPAGHPGCDLLQRWLSSDPAEPTQRLTLVTATGHLNPREAADPLARNPAFRTAHLRQFACQPFQYNDQAQHMEPIATSGPCPVASVRETTPH